MRETQKVECLRWAISAFGSPLFCVASEFDQPCFLCVQFQAKLAELKETLSRRCNDDLAKVGEWLQSVYRGWCQYYAVPGNGARLQQFRAAIQVMWLRNLQRRSQRGRRLTWAKFSKLCKRWLPTPKILHPYPSVRFACQHPR